MKTYKILFSLICIGIILISCSNKPSDAELAEATMNALYTSVAQTLSVITEQATDTATPTQQPTATLAPTATKAVTLSPTQAVATTTTCENAAFVADVTIPDRTVMKPGQEFTKTWSIKNSGTCDWTTSYKLAYLSGSTMSGNENNLTEALASGRAGNVSIVMIAPSVAGTYSGTWMMQNPSGQKFGQSVYVSIVVSGTAVTGTSTPTPTGTTTAATATPTLSPTPDINATVAAAIAQTAAADAAATAAADAMATAISAGQTATAAATTP